MKLTEPFKISSRLLPAVQIGDGWVSIEISGCNDEGRTEYRAYIDIPAGEFIVDDMRSGCGGGDIRDGMESLLSFLGAAAESYSYAERDGRDGMTGENADLFERAVVEWAAQHSDEIAMTETWIQGNPNCVQD